MLTRIKLQKAIQEIDEIFQKHDIGGVAFLHDSKHQESCGEFHAKLNPTNTCFSINPDGSLRMGVDLEEDFQGDKKEQEDKIKNSFAMLATLLFHHKHMYSQLKGIQEHFNHLAKQQGYEYNSGDLKIKPRESQNN